MMTAEMISAYNRHFPELKQFDQAVYTVCFVVDAVFRDPYGPRIFKGTRSLQKWLRWMERTWARIDIQPEAVFKSGDRVAV